MFSLHGERSPKRGPAGQATGKRRRTTIRRLIGERGTGSQFDTANRTE
jgi:hypothetical protein